MLNTQSFYRTLAFFRQGLMVNTSKDLFRPLPSLKARKNEFITTLDSSTHSARRIIWFGFFLILVFTSMPFYGNDIKKSPYAGEYPPLPDKGTDTNVLVPSRERDIIRAPEIDRPDRETQGTTNDVTPADQADGKKLTDGQQADPRASRTNAPDFRLRQRGGTAIRLSMLEGKISVLYFWSPACYSCADDIRKLEKIALAHEQDGLVILLINTLSTIEGNIHPSAERFKTTLPMLYPASQVNLAAYQVDILPTVMILDEQLRVAFWREGNEIIRSKEFMSVIKNELAAIKQPVDSNNP